jgi:superfamily I DNA and/or RNA helicase
MSLGLLLSPKRFNVAMTRAKALVIVVGAPDVLIQVISKNILSAVFSFSHSSPSPNRFRV